MLTCNLWRTFVAAFVCALGCVLLVPTGAGAQEQAVPAAQPPTADEPALTALEIKAVPTLTCIGVQWDVKGDSNANATGTLEFRQAGTADWKPAFPLRRTPFRANPTVKFMGGLAKWGQGMRNYALEHYHQNYLAGSVFGLIPGTTYELRLTLSDPDGGGATKTLTVATRAVPTIPADGRVVEVRGGGDALKQAAEAAQAGDILRVHAGKYNGGIVISAKGTEQKPVCITAAGDGEVLLHGGDAKKGELHGIQVTGSFVRIQGLSFYNFANCVRGERSANNLAVMGCRMNHFYTGIRARGDNGYYADNSIRESYNALDQEVAPGMRNEGHGIEFSTEGQGNVVCYNEISLVADGMRLYTRDSDVYGNDVIFNVDDGIELDDSGPNVRVFDNRWSFTGENGLSFQPYIGGPAFVIRNLVIGQKENNLKNRYESEAVVFINNTFVCRDGEPADLPYGSFTRNNLFLTIPGQGPRTVRVDVSPERLKRLDMDYDGFGPRGPNGLAVKEFAQQTGLEKHGLQLAADDDVLAKVPGPFPQYESKQWSIAEAFLTEKGRPHPDLSLKPGSPAISAGTVIANIAERPDGKAPDLGALQSGQPMPHYGPRP